MSQQDLGEPRDDLAREILAGRLSRRQVVRRALTLGLSASSVAALLAACGGGEEQVTETETPTGGGAATPTDEAEASPEASPEGEGSPAAGITPIEPRPDATGDLVVAYQPGIGYAQLLIARQNKWVEEALPNMNVSFKLLSSGAAIRDGMLAGEIHVGAGGIGPFLVGWDRGVGWKVITSMNRMSLWLMVADQKYQSLEDFTSGDQIAMPGPDSIQSIVLRKGAQEQLGDARALDQSIVAMSHPDGLQALLSGQIAGHLTSPPFQFQEQDEGAQPILQSFDLFGEHTFNSIFIRTEFYEQNPDAMAVLFKAVENATTMIHQDIEQAAQLVAQASETEAEAGKFQDWMTREGVMYEMVPAGFMDYAEFMREIGLLDKVPEAEEDIFFDLILNKMA